MTIYAEYCEIINDRKFKVKVWTKESYFKEYYVKTERQLEPGAWHEEFKEFETLSAAFAYVADMQKQYEDEEV